MDPQPNTNKPHTYQSALDAYRADIDELLGIEKRLIKEHDTKRAKLKTFKSAAHGRELLAEAKTIGSQIEKVRESAKESQQRFYTAVDAINAEFVERTKGLCAYGIGTGQANAGVKYLFGECKSFDEAKGDFQLRQACFDSVGNILAAITSKDAAEVSAVESKCVTQGRIKMHHLGRRFFRWISVLVARVKWFYGRREPRFFQPEAANCSP